MTDPYSLFISDLHLDENRPEHLQALEKLLEKHAGKAEALYVLGDLFEAWIGDDDDSDFNHCAITAFKRFSNSSSNLYFLRGNRDFLLGTRFAQETGGELLEEGTLIDLYGRPTLLMHGDSLCTDDQEYMAFRQQVRSDQWQKEFLGKPLEQRRTIALQMRQASQENYQNNPDNITDVNEAAVNQQMQQHGAEDLIHGHTHRPAVHEHNAGKRWVLGDWGKKGWKITSTPAGNVLENWLIE